MEKILVRSGRATRDVYETNKTTYAQVKVGSELFSYVVEIDEKSLMSLVGRAARNKNGKAVRGGLVAKIVSREAF